MSVIHKLASFDNDIDFPRLWRIGYVISAVLLLLAVGGLVVRGLNLGIDFEGGTSWDVPGAEVSTDEARDAVDDAGASAAKVQTIGRGDSAIVRVQSSTTDEAILSEVTTSLAAGRLGTPARGLDPWQTTTVEADGKPSLEITATPCRHGPPLSHPIVGDVIGFALRWDKDFQGKQALEMVRGRGPAQRLACLTFDDPRVVVMGTEPILHDGRVRRAYLGLVTSPAPLPPAWADRTGSRTGLRVVEVVGGSPAEASGMRAGDIILAVDVSPLGDAQSLQRLLFEDAIDSRMEITVLRNGALVDVVTRPAELTD